MPFYKKAYNSKQKVHYPRAIVQGKPVETETIAKDLAKISTVSNSDVQAVLGDIAGVMHTRMAQGKSVHIKGLGYFRYTLNTVGVKDIKDFNFAKQVKAVRVEFIPERTKMAGGNTVVPWWTATNWNGSNFRPKRKIRLPAMVAKATVRRSNRTEHIAAYR